MDKSIIAEIKELAKPVPPPYAKVLKTLPRKGVAVKLGVTVAYVIDILNGIRNPGAELEKKLIDLSASVESELKNQ